MQTLLGKDLVRNLPLLQQSADDSYQSERHLASLLMGKYRSGLLGEDAVRKELLKTLTDEEIRQLFLDSATAQPIPYARPEALRILSPLPFSGEYARGLIEILGLDDSYLPQPNERPIPFEVVQVQWPNYQLHPYQRNVCDKIFDAAKAGEKRLLVHMPTGAGKTRTTLEAIIAAWQAEGATDSFVIWLAPSMELCEQAAGTLRALWPHRGQRPLTVHRVWRTVRPDLDLDTNGFVIASTSTLNALLNGTAEERDIVRTLRKRAFCVVFDEAHHALAKTYHTLVESLVGENRASGWVPSLIGLTATPGRGVTQESNLALAEVFGGNKVTIDIGQLPDALPDETPIAYLQRQSYLARLKHYELDTGVEITAVEQQEQGKDIPRAALRDLSSNIDRNKLLVAAIKREVEDKRPALIFTCGTEHSRILSAILGYQGINAVAIESNTPAHVRARAIEGFKKADGSVPVLLNYDILSTGFDAPALRTLIVARPIFSVILYSQILGRALRGPKMGGQAECRVIDLRDNFERIPGVDHAFSYFDEFWRPA
ncbi:MAG: DEAD/DEAH box helicase family protein [Elusimicrobiota bacterium]|nr:MAG: DEAD/DEAH box helicase family protein [Elusimicrobiota bacterium]